MRSTVDTACAIEADVVSSTSARTWAPASRPGSSAWCRRCAQIVERCNDTTWLLLENSAGAGGTIGRSIDELAALIDAARTVTRGSGSASTRATSGSPGYDVTDAAALDSLLDEVDERIGLDRLRALHINDAQAPLGSNRDRHANIARGADGREARRLPRPPEAAGSAGGDGGRRARTATGRTRRR